MKNKVFLGGTCSTSTWRAELIPVLGIAYFNPVVENWTPACQAIEELEKKDSNIHLYVITKEMIGVYSVAEAVASAGNPAVITILHVIPEGFEGHALKSLNATVDLLRSIGAIAYIDEDLRRTARVLNNCFK